MNKKVVALFLVITTVLSGCGQSNRENVDSQNQVQEDSNSEPKTNGQESSETEEYEQPEMKGEITISAMIEQEFLKTAAEEFENKYPDITITIYTYQGTSGENAADDYRTLLNTKIMSGKAEDIIFSTQLPVKKYMGMGVFEDLSGYVSKTSEMNDKNYFMNVIESATDEKGKLFLLPYMSSFQVISFDKDVTEDSKLDNVDKEKITFEEAVSLAKKMTDQSELKNVYLMQGKSINYMESIAKEHQHTLIDMDEKTVNIDAEQYSEWLKEVQSMEKVGYFDSKKTIDYYSNEYHFAMVPDYDVQAAFYNVEGSLAMGAPMADEKGNVNTSSAYCFGLNSASKNKEIAWEFMKYLLSEEVQCLPSIHGLAVNRAGFESSVNRYMKFYEDGTGSNVDSGEYKKLLMQWVEQINSCDVLDPVIIDYLNAENSKYFEGMQSAEKTAQILQNKITQYLNE